MYYKLYTRNVNKKVKLARFFRFCFSFSFVRFFSLQRSFNFCFSNLKTKKSRFVLHTNISEYL